MRGLPCYGASVLGREASRGAGAQRGNWCRLMLLKGNIYKGLIGIGGRVSGRIKR